MRVIAVLFLLAAPAMTFNMTQELKDNAENVIKSYSREALYEIPNPAKIVSEKLHEADLLDKWLSIASPWLDYSPFSAAAFELAMQASRLETPEWAITQKRLRAHIDGYRANVQNTRMHASNYILLRPSCPMTGTKTDVLLSFNVFVKLMCERTRSEYYMMASSWESALRSNAELTSAMLNAVEEGVHELDGLGADMDGYGGKAAAQLSRGMAVLKRLASLEERPADCGSDAEAAVLCFNRLNRLSGAGFRAMVEKLNFVAGSHPNGILLDKISSLISDLQLATGAMRQEYREAISSAGESLERAKLAASWLKKEDARLADDAVLSSLSRQQQSEAVLYFGSALSPRQELYKLEMSLSGFENMMRKVEKLAASGEDNALGASVASALRLGIDIRESHSEAERYLDLLESLRGSATRGLKAMLDGEKPNDVLPVASSMLESARNAPTSGAALESLARAFYLLANADSSETSTKGLLERANSLLAAAKEYRLDVSQEEALLINMAGTHHGGSHISGELSMLIGRMETRLRPAVELAESKRSMVVRLLSSIEALDRAGFVTIDTEAVRARLSEAAMMDSRTNVARLSKTYDEMRSELERALLEELPRIITASSDAVLTTMSQVECNRRVVGAVVFVIQNPLGVQVPALRLKPEGFPAVTTHALMPGESQLFTMPFNDTPVRCSIAGSFAHADDRTSTLELELKLAPKVCVYDFSLTLPEADYFPVTSPEAELEGNALHISRLCKPASISLSARSRSPLVIELNYSNPRPGLKSYVMSVTNNASITVRKASVSRRMGSATLSLNTSLGPFETKIDERVVVSEPSAEAEQVMLDIERLAASLNFDNQTAAGKEVDYVEGLYKSGEFADFMPRAIRLRSSLDRMAIEASENAFLRASFEADHGAFESLREEVGLLLGENAPSEALALYKKAQGLAESAMLYNSSGHARQAQQKLAEAVSALGASRLAAKRHGNQTDRLVLMSKLGNSISLLCAIGSCSLSSGRYDSIKSKSTAFNDSELNWLRDGLASDAGRHVERLKTLLKSLESTFRNYSTATELDGTAANGSAFLAGYGDQQSLRLEYYKLKAINGKLAGENQMDSVERLFKEYGYDEAVGLAQRIEGAERLMRSVTSSLEHRAGADLSLATAMVKQAANRQELVGLLNKAKDSFEEGRYAESIKFSKMILEAPAIKQEFPFAIAAGAAIAITTGLLVFRRLPKNEDGFDFT
ncbi:hypothetical protein HYS54_04345 [Candidatus Micrarchaeota archaeon]|nr:hypothetical protein [Candidatus Micrarchaeota archaeon]